MKNNDQEKALLFKIKTLTIFYIFALFFWGITAFPLESEIRILTKILGIDINISPEIYEGFKGWIAIVADGIINTNKSYPFMAYGTDWLAFSHIVIGIAFIGVYLKPVRNIWVVYFGMISCIGVLPLALICGQIREIPFFWTLIDCSFCVFGIVPLVYLRKYIKQLEVLIGYTVSKY